MTPKCGPSSSSAAFVSKSAADGPVPHLLQPYLGGSGGGTGWADRPPAQEAAETTWALESAVDANDNAGLWAQNQLEQLPHYGQCYSLNCEPAEIASGAYIIFDSKPTVAAGRTPRDTSTTAPILCSSSNSTRQGRICCTERFLGGTNGELAAQIALDAAGDIVCRGIGLAPTSPERSRRRVTITIQPRHPRFQTQALTGGAYSAFVTEFRSGRANHPLFHHVRGPNENTYNNALAVERGKSLIGGFTQDPHLPQPRAPYRVPAKGSPTAAGPRYRLCR